MAPAGGKPSYDIPGMPRVRTAQTQLILSISGRFMEAMTRARVPYCLRR